MRPALTVHGVHKKFLQKRSYHALRGALQNVALAPIQRSVNGARGQGQSGEGQTGEARWALQDVSFEIQAGECVALIGHNGAGKSVLLRVLARVTRPTRGEVVVCGSVGAVLDVGVGFNRELTGRENIFLQGAILGIQKRDLRRKYDSIVELSGMQDFLEQPLKTYSNGMQVRLAFAVAAQLEPEILLMDEVLAVADEDFIRVCVQKLGELRNEGRTILLASHDLALLSQVCTRALWLERGCLIGDGKLDDIAGRYHAQASGS